MDLNVTFDDHLAACWDDISPGEQRVARFFQEHREEVLIASAAALARQIGTSDATVVRTAKALGFTGMEELRRTLARGLRDDLSLAGRLVRTLGAIGDDPQSAFDATLEIHLKSLQALHRDITPADFRQTVEMISSAARVFIFGLGPSSAMADYFTIQLGRFGIDAHSLTQTGLLLADGVNKLARGDLLLIFAYGRVYPELAVLLDQAARRGVTRVLFSDTLGASLRSAVDLVLPVARGRADMLSMHTATLALIEALLVGVAVDRPKQTVANLDALNEVRTALAGKAMDLPTP
ncbi:MAG: MurR/RpiR family transcriptional regulator [Hyphomicrobiales bacterium]